jgi:hypothetical protein
MKMERRFLFVLVVAACAFALPSGREGWRSEFKVNKADLQSTGSNPYFVLNPGFRLYYEKGKSTLITTVLNETKMIDGVEARAVEDREMKSGELTEVTRDYYAMDPNSKDVYYFGEDVDMYKNGKVVGHGGSWLSGVKGAKFGMMMPGKVEVGQRFYQEQAPGVGMDRAEVVAVGETIVTPAGTFKDCVHTMETSVIEKGHEEKWYAPGVGIVKDPEYVLTKVEGK